MGRIFRGISCTYLAKAFPLGSMTSLATDVCFTVSDLRFTPFFLELSLKSYQKASVYKSWHLYQWVHLDWHAYGVNTVVSIPE